MTYQETVEFLYARLPYFTRDGKAAIKKDLGNTLRLCEILGNPQQRFTCIHVAGTNGKGSSSNMLAAILQAHGFKTGLYTSPHLKDFRERIRINGEMASEDFVVDFTRRIQPHLDSIQPSFFEITVAMCFEYFATRGVQYAVIETGLGGRLDSTNILQPILSVITNIGMDHMDLLGDSLEKIAAEKAGIIKPGVPVVIGESQAETDAVFRQKALECRSEIHFADKNPCFYNTEVETDLQGIYQQRNGITVLQACAVLKTLGLPLDDFTTAKALKQVRKLTRFRGRWEILGTAPKVIADTAHNAHGIAMVCGQLKQEQFQTLHMVIGMVKDKDRNPVLALLPKEAVYYFCKPALPRALEPELLRDDAAAFGLQGKAYPSVADALAAARAAAGAEDTIFIGGSTFVVAEAL